MRLRRRRLARAAVCLGLALPLLLAGCGGGRIGKQGDVRLVNATGDAVALDLYADDGRIAASVGGDASSGYAGVDTGSRTLSLRQSTTGAQVAAAGADIGKDAHYTVVAYTTAGATAAVLLAEDESAPSEGSAKLRVFNAASADSGALDAYLSPGGCSSLGASNSVASKVTSAAVGTWATVGAGGAGTSYHFCVTAAGDNTDLRLDLFPLVLASRQVTTVVLTGTPGGVLVNAVVVNQQGAVAARRNPAARVRVVADAAAHASVDASVNGSSLADAAVSPTVGLYEFVAAGALDGQVRIGGVTVPVPALTAAPGADLTLLVAGSAAAPTVVWLADDNRSSTASASPARLRLVHGINGGMAPLTLRAAARNVAPNVAFGTASTPANVAGGAIALSVTAAGASTPIYSTTSTNAATLESGGVYTLFMLGDVGEITTTLERDR